MGHALSIEKLVLPDLVRVEHLAQALGLCATSVRRLIRDGTIPARRIGRRWIITRGELLAALSAPAAVCADCCRRLPPVAASATTLPVCSPCARTLAQARQGRPA
jgi:excisionase family DNA binding protein